MASMGPVEYVLIAFPGNRFKGEIVPAVAELVDNEIVRIIDVAFIKKDASGNTTMFEYDVLDDVLAFGFADVDGEAGGCSTTRISSSPPRASSPTARRR